MAFVPTLGMIVWIPGRNETTAVVKGIDTTAAEMWLLPFTGGGSKFTATISDRWAEVPASKVTEAWFLAGPAGPTTAWSRPYFTQAGANNAVDATTTAVLHVLPTGLTQIGWII